MNATASLTTFATAALATADARRHLNNAEAQVGRDFVVQGSKADGFAWKRVEPAADLASHVDNVTSDLPVEQAAIKAGRAARAKPPQAGQPVSEPEGAPVTDSAASDAPAPKAKASKAKAPKVADERPPVEDWKTDERLVVEGVRFGSLALADKARQRAEAKAKAKAAKAAKAPASATPRAPTRLEAAAAGVMPTPPDFTRSETSKPYLPRLQKIIDMVAAKDIAGLRGCGVSVTMANGRLKLMAKYRDAAVIALLAQGVPDAKARAPEPVAKVAKAKAEPKAKPAKPAPKAKAPKAAKAKPAVVETATEAKVVDAPATTSLQAEVEAALGA